MYMFALIMIEMRISYYIYTYDIMLDNCMMGLYTASIYFLVHSESIRVPALLISNLLDPRNEPCTLDNIHLVCT